MVWGPHICCLAEGEGQGLVAELHFGRGASRGKPRGGCGGAARGAVRGGNAVGVEGAHVHSQTPPPLLLKVVRRSPPLPKLADFFPHRYVYLLAIYLKDFTNNYYDAGPPQYLIKLLEAGVRAVIWLCSSLEPELEPQKCFRLHNTENSCTAH